VEDAHPPRKKKTNSSIILGVIPIDSTIIHQLTTKLFWLKTTVVVFPIRSNVLRRFFAFVFPLPKGTKNKTHAKKRTTFPLVTEWPS
jgi:hypothetical protein